MAYLFTRKNKANFTGYVFTFIVIVILGAISTYITPLADLMEKVFWQWLGGLNVTVDIVEFVLGILANIGQDSASVAEAAKEVTSQMLGGLAETIIKDIFDIILCAVICYLINKLPFFGKYTQWLSYFLGIFIACNISAFLDLGKDIVVVIAEAVISIVVLFIAIRLIAGLKNSAQIPFRQIAAGIIGNGSCAVLCIVDLGILYGFSKHLTFWGFVSGCIVLAGSLFLMYLISNAANVVKNKETL